MSDVAAGRAAGAPDAVFTVVDQRAPQAVSVRGHAVASIRLCQYVERDDRRRGPYSLITAVVETDAGTAELVYDEGYRGSDALASSGRFLIEHLGVLPLAERAVVALESHRPDAGGPRPGP